MGKKPNLSGEKRCKEATFKWYFSKSSKFHLLNEITVAVELHKTTMKMGSQEKPDPLKGIPCHFSRWLGCNEKRHCQIVELLMTQSTLITGK